MIIHFLFFFIFNSLAESQFYECEVHGKAKMASAASLGSESVELKLTISKIEPGNCPHLKVGGEFGISLEMEEKSLLGHLGHLIEREEELHFAHTYLSAKDFSLKTWDWRPGQIMEVRSDVQDRRELSPVDGDRTP